MKKFLLIGCVYSIVNIMYIVLSGETRNKLGDSFDAMREALGNRIIADLICTLIIVVTSILIIVLWPISAIIDIVSFVKKHMKH